jgi:hypothetical protein
VPEHAAPVPHRHPRFEQAFASSGLQAPPVHAVHTSKEFATHAAVPELSQQSWFWLQPREPPGSHAPHSPF